MVAMLTGIVVPAEPIVSSSNALLVEFISDGTEQGQGFVTAYYKTLGRILVISYNTNFGFRLCRRIPHNSAHTRTELVAIEMGGLTQRGQ